MRTLFILLFLLNTVLLYFTFIVDDAVIVDTEASTKKQQLYLIDEQKTDELNNNSVKDIQVQQINNSVTSEAVDKSESLVLSDNHPSKTQDNIICVKIINNLNAQQQTFLNENELYSLRSSGDESYIKQRYWVHIPPYNNKEDSTKAQAKLTAAGIKDSFIVKRGENINSISLGLFSTPESADKIKNRVNKIAALKKKAIVEVIELTSERKWIMYQILLNNKQKAEEELAGYNLVFNWQDCDKAR